MLLSGKLNPAIVMVPLDAFGVVELPQALATTTSVAIAANIQCGMSFRFIDSSPLQPFGLPRIQPRLRFDSSTKQP
jgi:hypothetical protein